RSWHGSTNPRSVAHPPGRLRGDRLCFLFSKLGGRSFQPFCVTKSHGDWVERKQKTELDTAKPRHREAKNMTPRSHLTAKPPEEVLAALRKSVNCGCPFGEAAWSNKMVRRLGLEMTLRPQGRPRKRH